MSDQLVTELQWGRGGLHTSSVMYFLLTEIHTENDFTLIHRSTKLKLL